MLGRTAVVGLVLLLVLLQGRLWVSDDGLREVARLERLISQQRQENARLARRNYRLEAEVRQLRAGETAVEERARSDLGLVGHGETFYLFADHGPGG